MLRIMSLVAVCLIAVCLIVCCASSAQAAEESQEHYETRALIAKIEKVEQKLRDREINIDEFKKEFAEIEGIPEGSKRDRILSAWDTKELRSALDSLKSEILPTPWYVTAIVVGVVILIALMVIAAIATGEPMAFFWIFLIFNSGGGGSDF